MFSFLFFFAFTSIIAINNLVHASFHVCENRPLESVPQMGSLDQREYAFAILINFVKFPSLEGSQCSLPAAVYVTCFSPCSDSDEHTRAHTQAMKGQSVTVLSNNCQARGDTHGRVPALSNA